MPFKSLSEFITWELSQNKNTLKQLSSDHNSADKLTNCIYRKLRYLSAKSAGAGADSGR
jgi:hypothetical protein